MHALIENGAVKRYPYTVTDLRRDVPGVSFPKQPDDDTLVSYNVHRVFFSTPPDVSDNQVIEQGIPTFDGERWNQVWIVRDKTAEEIQIEQQQLQDSIVAAVQQRLDDFAKTRGYDDIKSASDYAAQTAVPKFQAEGQYALNQRAATWAKLYEILAEVEAGTRPMPTSFADIEPELPELVWSV